MTWFETIAGNQRTCSRASARSSETWLGAQTMHSSASGSRPSSAAAFPPGTMLALLGYRGDERQRRLGDLPEDVPVVRPAVLEAMLLGLLHQLDQPRVRRIGQDCDAKGEGHPRRAYAEPQGISASVL